MPMRNTITCNGTQLQNLPRTTIRQVGTIFANHNIGIYILEHQNGSQMHINHQSLTGTLLERASWLTSFQISWTH